MKKETFLGHFFAVFSVFVWGNTYIATKTLLQDFSPEGILFFRHLIAFVVLTVAYPKRQKKWVLKEELLFLTLGVTGVTLYFWSENMALQYTYASNVGFIVSSIPILTALFAHLLTKDEKLSGNLMVGFVAAMVGILIIMFNGKSMALNPLGDILALCAAILFAIYSVLIKKIKQEYSQLWIIKKIFTYGFIMIVPLAFASDSELLRLPKITVGMATNMMFLALVASILCFMMWNKAVKMIGSIKTTNYVYLVPAITMISSVIVLHEKVSFLMIVGGAFIFLGVYINEAKWLRLGKGFGATIRPRKL